MSSLPRRMFVRELVSRIKSRKTKCRFLQLPLEVRLIIYDHILRLPESFNLCFSCLYNLPIYCTGIDCFQARDFAITRVCRQVAAECRIITRKTTAFYLSSLETIDKFDEPRYDDPGFGDALRMGTSLGLYASKMCANVGLGWMLYLACKDKDFASSGLRGNILSPSKFWLGKVALSFPYVNRIELSFEEWCEAMQQILYFFPRLEQLLITAEEENYYHRKYMEWFAANLSKYVDKLRDRGLIRLRHLKFENGNGERACIGIVEPNGTEKSKSNALTVRHVDVALKTVDSRKPLGFKESKTDRFCFCSGTPQGDSNTVQQRKIVLTTSL